MSRYHMGIYGDDRESVRPHVEGFQMGTLHTTGGITMGT